MRFFLYFFLFLLFISKPLFAEPISESLYIDEVQRNNIIKFVREKDGSIWLMKLGVGCVASAFNNNPNDNDSTEHRNAIMYYYGYFPSEQATIRMESAIGILQCEVLNATQIEQ